MATTALQLSDVSKKFGRQTVLNHINMTIEQGDIYGLIGENGAGKSTLMRLITGLSPLRNGQIMLLGENRGQAGYDRSLQRVGTIIESPALYPHLTVYQNLVVSAKQKGVANRQDIQDTIQFVGLTEKAKVKAKRLSLGQRQRLGLAIALLAQPDFLILDEPINGLDPMGIIEIRDLLHRLNTEQQTTILISSHILTELYQVCTRFGFIHRGHLIQEITKKDLDAANQSGIILHVADVNAASEVLDAQHIKPFNVMNNHQIIIYNNTLDTGEINYQLNHAGVRVDDIQTQSGSLETYFTTLLQKADQKGGASA